MTWFNSQERNSYSRRKSGKQRPFTKGKKNKTTYAHQSLLDLVTQVLNQGRCFSPPVYKNIPKYQKPLKVKKKPRLKAPVYQKRFKPLVTFALDSMAGLQYYFFPTDFFYPRPSSTDGDNTSNPVLHVQTQKQADAGNIEKCKIVVHNDVQGSNKLYYQPSTSCTALVPYPCIIKKELRRKRSIVANCGNNNNCG